MAGASRGLAAILVLHLVCAGCGRSSAPVIRLGIAAQQSITQLPVYLAAQLGYYEVRGLRVEFSEFSGASKGLEALAGGSLDVLSGYYPQVLQMRKQGRKYAVLLPVFDSLFVALAVSPAASAPVRRMEDLKGRKVGVPAFGSTVHQLLDFLLRQHGMSPADVTPIAISTATRAAAAMERGLVDAGMVSDFTIRYLEQRSGKVTLLADTRTREAIRAVHGINMFPSTVLMAGPDWLAAHGAEAEKLRAAVKQAMDWMRAHTAEEIAEKMPPTHYGEDKAAYVEAIRLGIPLLSVSDTIGAEAHRVALEFLPAELR